MKNAWRIMMLSLVIICSAFFANAQSEKGDLITNKGYAFVVDDKNANVELHPGLTAGEWKRILSRFTKAKFGEDLQTVLDGSVFKDSGSAARLYNTYWKDGKPQATKMRLPIRKAVLSYKGEDWLVAQCAQPLSSDAGLINNAINSADQTVDEEKKDQNQNNNTQTNLKNENDMKSTVDTVQHLVSGGVNHFTNPSTGNSNDNLAFYAFLAFMVIAALVLIAIMAFRAIRGRDGYSHSHHTISSSTPGSPAANPGYNEDAEKTAFKSIKRAFEIIDEVRENDEAFLKKHKAHGPTEITVIEGEGANKKVTTTKF